MSQDQQLTFYWFSLRFSSKNHCTTFKSFLENRQIENSWDVAASVAHSSKSWEISSTLPDSILIESLTKILEYRILKIFQNDSFYWNETESSIVSRRSRQMLQIQRHLFSSLMNISIEIELSRFFFKFLTERFDDHSVRTERN